MFDLYPYAPPSVWMRLRPDAVAIWSDEEVKRRLSWYYMVMRDEAPARFMIAKYLEAPDPPYSLDTDELWRLHDKLAVEHRKLWMEARRGSLSLHDDFFRSKPEYSYLSVKIELAQRIVRKCHFCERRCMVNRVSGPGFCGVDAHTYVHSWFHHLGEEAPLVPSGTIFYGGCNFRCVYCQNYDISQEAPRAGSIVDARRLAQIQRELRIHGARNINHVGGDPTPNIHTILESFEYLDVNTPQLWNSNMYMTPEAMKLLADVIDIWLPDFKYGNDKCAKRLSAAPYYVEVVVRNLVIAVDNGDMIIRHLVLPGHVQCCSKPVMRLIASRLPVDRILVNIMDQYRPEYLVARYPDRWPEIARRPRASELREVYEYARSLGILFEPLS